MKFQNAASVETICSQMLLADYPRALNRARINELFNGWPPYSEEEVLDNNIGTNVNFLESSKIAHDARRQFSTAFCSPDPLFTIELDYGPQWKRQKWANIIQKEMNKLIKGSLPYLELRGSTFASLVLHGVGPVMWEDDYHWCPEDLGIEDVLVPSNTFRSMKNLPFFVVQRQYTVPQLQRLTRGKNVDRAWNLPLVKQCIEWADKEAQVLMGSNWSDVWSPEKQVERMKGDGGWYASDAVPTIDVFDFYFHDEKKGSSGWKRKMILNAWGNPGAGGATAQALTEATRKFEMGKGDFLYDSGDRIYADAMGKVMHFNFADCSSVAPFRYHAVRSLGFLLYGVCHLQNRTRCKFNDAVFESLLQYFRVANPADMDRLMKINLVDKGVLEDGVQFVKPEERWKIDDAIVMQAMQLNRQTMSDNSASFTQDFDFDSAKGGQETATRTMAKVNNTTALVGAMLGQAYNYQTFQYQEIARRFCIKDSRDLDVGKFRVRCFKKGVPPAALNIDAWNVQPVRVIGAGNKMMASAVADKLMAIAPRLDPTAQREIDKLYIAANSDDYSLADRLVPEQPVVSDTVHDTEIVFGSLMQGSRVTPKPGLHPQEVVETMLKQITLKVQGIMQSGGVGTPQDVQGLMLAAQYTDAFIKMLSQDPTQKARVAAYGKQLGKVMNEVKGMQQRQQEAAKQASQQGQEDPATAAKVKATIITAQTKAGIATSTHAQRTAQKQIQFEAKMKMDAEQHQADITNDLREHAAELAKTGMDAQHAARNARLKTFSGKGEK